MATLHQNVMAGIYLQAQGFKNAHVLSWHSSTRKYREHLGKDFQCKGVQCWNVLQREAVNFGEVFTNSIVFHHWGMI